MKDIRVQNVSKSYGDEVVLNKLSFDIVAGKVTAIVGASGIGKTTILRILMGLEKQDTGSIEADSDMRISACFQEDRLCENLNSVGNIRLVSPSLIIEEVVKHLEDFGLLESKDKKVSELSGGMRRRVALLRAVLNDANVIYMDEPFKGLDDETKQKVIQKTARLVENRTVVIVTHDIGELNSFHCDKIIDLNIK